MSEQSVRLSVVDAALRLGVSVDTIRRRIKAQEIKAQRDNTGKWWVVLPADAEPVPQHPAGHALAPVSMPAPAPLFAAAPQPVRSDLFEYVLRENDRLWDQLKARDDMIRDLIDRITAVGAVASRADRSEVERDEARLQLRELKILVGQMLSKMARRAPMLSDDDD